MTRRPRAPVLAAIEDKATARELLKAMADRFAQQHPEWGRTTLYQEWHKQEGHFPIPIRLFRSLPDLRKRAREGGGQGGGQKSRGKSSCAPCPPMA